ncbi:tRNA pseudouridine synthase A [Candidatus Nasuia deltocephalinicola]|nr:tRNA pseudouridine synthase A [Candidatus Nasuia deltocephalinicola]
MNYIIYISYNGFFYLGSQSQLNFKSIHDQILLSFFKLNKKIYKIVFSSRTDKKVNSLLQIIQIYNKSFFLKKKIFIINNILKNISINAIIQISKKFHSVYSVISRIYCYIFNFYKCFFNFFFLKKKKINIYFLFFFINHLIGLKNFLLFNSLFIDKLNCIRLIYEINIVKKNNFLYFIIKGNSFLYNMIRNIISYFLFLIFNNYEIFFLSIFYLNYNFFLPSVYSYSLFLVYINYPLFFNH